MTLLGELLLLDESVLVQPLHQLRAIGGDHLRLRHVDMGVDEPRRDQMRAMISNCGAGRQRRQQLCRFAGSLDQAVFDDEQPVLDIAMRGLAGLVRISDEPEKSAAQGRDRTVFAQGSPLRLKSPSYLHQEPLTKPGPIWTPAIRLSRQKRCAADTAGIGKGRDAASE